MECHLQHLGYLFFLALTAILASAGEAQWTSVSSPNFEVITTDSAGDARRAAEYFEQVREFFMRVKSQQLTTRLPVSVVIFRNAKEFKAYSTNEGAAAYYTGDRSHDFIVMSGFGDEHKATAVHEYMHLLVRHLELKLPVWLNEGIAEVYSTLQPHGGKIAVGHVPQGRSMALAKESWLALPRLFLVNHDSPEYNERSRMGILYAQSWLLTHMLMLEPKYSGKFAGFLGQIASDIPSETAFEKVYGKTSADITKDLRAYFRAPTLRGVIFEGRLEKLKVGEPRPADPYQVELTLSRLTAMLDRRDEAAARLERLTKEHPTRWEPLKRSANWPGAKATRKVRVPFSAER